MKKTNIVLSVFNAILSIALIIMIFLYFNMKENSKICLESSLNSANEVSELNNKIQKLEDELELYKKSGISIATNTVNNKGSYTEPYIPEEIEVDNPENNSGTLFVDREYNRSPENVKIEVLENTITNTSVEILITDNNEYKYAWGVPFNIQKKENGEWKNLEYVSDELAWISIAYNLDKNNQLKQKLDIEEYYGQLEPGIYRVVKSVYDEGNIDLYSNEFEIK